MNYAPVANASINYPDTSMGRLVPVEPKERAKDNWKKGKYFYDICTGYMSAFKGTVGNKDLTQTKRRTKATIAPSSSSSSNTSTANRCPAGTSYAHIKIGGLLFKKTLFKGCGTPNQLAYWRSVSNDDMRARWKNFGNALQKGAKEYNDSIQRAMPRTCTSNVIGSTVYTNCY